MVSCRPAGTGAADAGLPVPAVVAFAQSFGDSVHTSARAWARWGRAAVTAGAGPAKLGVATDDVAVISKHDTSTLATTPTRPSCAGGSPTPWAVQGAPLFVVSQKSLTGHAKRRRGGLQMMIRARPNIAG